MPALKALSACDPYGPTEVGGGSSPGAWIVDRFLHPRMSDTRNTHNTRIRARLIYLRHCETDTPHFRCLPDIRRIDAQV